MGSARQVAEAFVEAEKGIKRDQTLVSHDGADSASEFLVRAPAVGRVLGGTGEQIDKLILGEVCVAGGGKQS
jgi:hypothetical protein